MKKYLVTGGLGFVGSSLARRLAAEGHQVTVLDDFSRGHAGRLHGVPCVIVHGDVRDPAVVIKAMHGCDTVVHLAYLQGTQSFTANPKTVLDVAMRGMLNILSACEKTGCADLLLASSSEAYQVASVVPTPETIALTVPDPLNPRFSYGGGKIACELMALAWQREGILDRALITRLHNAYGPDGGAEHVIPEFCLRMNALVREQPEGILEFPIQGTGLETRSFCFIDDCVEQMVLVLNRAPEGPGIYHVGTMVERTIAQVAHEVAECYGREIKVVPGTLPKGSPPRRLPDTTKIDLLAGAGNLRRTPFNEGLAKTVQWYREHC